MNQNIQTVQQQAVINNPQVNVQPTMQPNATINPINNINNQ